MFTKFGRKVAHGPRKKPLDVGGNPDHVTLDLGLWLGGARDKPTTLGMFTWRVLNGNNFARSSVN